MNNLIVVGGPTASGKTKLAIELAKKIKYEGGEAEIINADSVQMYKYLDIGSAKGNLKEIDTENIEVYKIPIVDIENTGTKGHLFNIVEPDKDFNVVIYQRLAIHVIKNLWQKNVTPIVVGGTGLYIDSIIKGYDMQNEEVDENLRKKLNDLEVRELQEKLKKLDAEKFESLNNSDKNNPRRLIRYIEKQLKATNQDAKPNSPKLDSNDYELFFYYPKFDRKELMQKINHRVIEMFNNGFVSEVQSLLDNGYFLNLKSMQSSGYKEVARMLINNSDLSKKNITEEECINLVQLVHRQYAKRQIIWFEGKARGYELIKI